MRASGYARNADDFYIEPEWFVNALLAVERFDGNIVDPACGTGTIPLTAQKCGYQALGFDLKDRGFGVSHKDFLSYDFVGVNIDNIVCNPPYNLLEQFVHKGLQVAARKVCMLARLAFLEGQKRKTLFESTPLATVWVSRKRVSMPPGLQGIKATGGTIAFAWFVWDKSHNGDPKIGWV